MGSPKQSEKLFIGLMSGTSMDGVDAALIRFGNRSCELLATTQQPYRDTLRAELQDASRNIDKLTVDRLCSLDSQVAECFAETAFALLGKAQTGSHDVAAIGSHGQTIRHQPVSVPPYSLQIGDPNIIAARTGLTTVADFRRRDIAEGGQGAPLAPAFHDWLFGGEFARSVVLNIGGIANITVIATDNDQTIGFDTGPGNTLLDGWISRHKSVAYDESGKWAGAGTVSDKLLRQLMADAYFSVPPPKSTGFEYFNLDWLQESLRSTNVDDSIAAEDIQATLAELTARSIADAVKIHAQRAKQVYVCGGGIHNDNLMSRIRAHLPDFSCVSTADCGLPPDWVEAAAFAWLARQTLGRLPGNLPSVTGASRSAVLGGVYFGTG